MEHLSKHDEKAHAILGGAAQVFSSKGYHHASMRDIARETGMSLAGMYHYFSGKEEILFSIQRFCFRQVLDDVEARLAGISDPAEKLRAVVYGHLKFFTQNVTEMRVLSHEADSLNGEYRQHINEMKREYYNMVAKILEELHDGGWSDAERRRTTLSIFGMINWIYTWYRPDRDGSPEELADTMMNIITNGIATPTKAG
jgi:AcrR family transcriptional regulator